MESSPKPQATNSRPLVLVDGRSGAGKTYFATGLARDMGATLVSIDDAYPGWHGLDAGSFAIYRDVILPFSRGEEGEYQCWDWEASRYYRSVRVPSSMPLVIEGCGALRREAIACASETIWLEAPEDVRLARALARDGEAYAIAWKLWALQEERFIALHQPDTQATTLYYTG
jgi:cytidylate kinase